MSQNRNVEPSLVPQPAAGVDIKSLAIGPEEAFVFTRVDGRSSDQDIAAATNLDVDRVRAILQRLRALGAVSFDGDVPGVEPKKALAETERPPAQSTDAAHAQTVPPDAADTADTVPPNLYDAAELDEEVDLSRQRRKQILDWFYRLDELNYYDLFKIPGDAEKKEIKAAYYDIVAVYHPDKYYGKSLGSFKAKLDRIFDHLTNAHDTLTRKRSRAEYDDELRAAGKFPTRKRSGVQPAHSTSAKSLTPNPTASQPSAAPTNPVPPYSRPTPAGSVRIDVKPSINPEARRRNLARKLSGSFSAVRTSKPPSATKDSADHALKSLHAKYTQQRGSQLSEYLAAADKALAENNPVSAASALRVALGLTPDDKQLAGRLATVQLAADEQVSARFKQQAVTFEQQGKLLEASQSYEKAAIGANAANFYKKAAECLLQANTELRHAGELARRSAAAAPEDPQIRVTLARIYSAAGMHKSAVGELGRALKDHPGDANIRKWLERIRDDKT